MASTEATPRYRNFSNNMPSSIIQTPRAPSSSLIAVEKEPERDPEDDCFMCRQAHVYVKPIGMNQERRVARRHPPPLTRTQIDELSRKKQLTKLEARKLLQCYFPEIKDVKYFQLHKYHSCCYDPKHLNLCKNHITALQREREEHPNHQHQHHHHQSGNGTSDNPYKDHEREGAQQNRVSFVRIKIEPTKGIPTRFLGPTVLPESLADMLIKQVNRLEDKKTKSSEPYNVRRVNNPYGSSEDDDENNDDDDEEDDDSDDHGDNHQMARRGKSTNGDLVVEDLDELNRLYVNRQDGKDSNHNTQTFSKPLKKKKRKKGTNKGNTHGHQKSKLKHWELMALEQSKQETCNCRHHVMRLEADHVIYDWCRCKDHQHKDIVERRKSIAVPPPAPAEQPVRPPPPPPQPKPRAKPRKVQTKSIGIDATEPTTTELALAYDPAAVDYDMIQEVIYYRTASGRLIKPEISNAFTYDTMPPAMDINHQERVPNKAEVLYMTANGQLKPFEAGRRHRGKNTDRPFAPKSITLSHPGSLYNGQAFIDPEHSPSTNGRSGAMPVLKLPPSMTSSRQHSSGQNSNNHQPAEFTLAKFSSDKSVGTPSSRRSIASDTQGKFRPVPMTMQKSSKPTYSNLEPTPDYGRESSVVANRRWFDQPLGDQNLRPVHDGQYGLIAGASTDKYATKTELSDDEYTEAETTMNKNGGNCTIS